jgi:hypothetical protein
MKDLTADNHKTYVILYSKVNLFKIKINQHKFINIILDVRYVRKYCSKNLKDFTKSDNYI